MQENYIRIRSVKIMTVNVEIYINHSGLEKDLKELLEHKYSGRFRQLPEADTNDSKIYRIRVNGDETTKGLADSIEHALLSKFEELELKLYNTVN